MNKHSGQPFGYGLFDLERFDCGTEPTYRAIVMARVIASDKLLQFYELTQHYFFVKNIDPKSVWFYLPMCKELSIDFVRFCSLFISEEIRYQTRQDFMLSSSWGVGGFPSVIYKHNGKLNFIAQSYSPYDKMIEIIEKINSEN